MGKSEKHDITLANFNCTFGANNEPMLSYFDTIIFPAFTSGEIRRKSDDVSFFFHNVRVLEYKNELVLTGNFIKETKLEVKSHYFPGKGLIPTYEVHPTSPYSIFIIFLKNHRMVFYRNQKGSPLLSAFKGTADFLVKKYLSKINEGKTFIDSLPGAYLKIIPIPSLQSLTSQLQSLKKINSLTLNLFPLNNDIGISETFDSLRYEVSSLGTTTAKVTISSPKNINQTANLITNTQGTIEAVVRGRNSTDGKVTLHPDSFTETVSVEIDRDDSYLENTLKVLDATHDHTSIQMINDNNYSLYLDKVDIIKSKME